LVAIEIMQLDDYEIVSKQLGRPAAGFREVVCRRPDGTPAVIRVDSLVLKRPFPTLFWLTDTELDREIGLLESRGLTSEFQNTIDADPELQLALRNDNLAHIELREGYMSDEVRRAIEDLNFYDTFQTKGIGGNANFSRVRCLHCHVAAHLVVPNTIGKMLDEYFEQMEHPILESFRHLSV